MQVQSARVRRAVLARDGDSIRDLVTRQVAAGADAVDLNLGANWAGGAEDMAWLVETAQSGVTVPLFIDSADVETLEAGVASCRNFAVINSADASPERLPRLAALAAGTGAALVVLPVADGVLPGSLASRVGIVDKIVQDCESLGLAQEKLLVDALALPAFTGPHGMSGVKTCLRFVEHLGQRGLCSVAGIRNVSYGLQAAERRLIDALFLALASAAGLDVALCDPMDGAAMRASDFLSRTSGTKSRVPWDKGRPADGMSSLPPAG